MTAPKVIVVGAGIGGLAAALALAAEGHAVTVVETDRHVGGKIRRATAVDVDAGPTVLTLIGVFRALFRLAGAELDDYVSATRLPVLAAHTWPDGDRLVLYADRRRSADAIGDFAGARAAEQYLAYLARNASRFAFLDETFLRQPQAGLPGLLRRAGRKGVSNLFDIHAFNSLWSELGRAFDEPRLRQLYGRYATYCGSSPFEAPATLGLIAAVEAAGVWQIGGGLSALPAALARRARELGSRILVGQRVHSIDTRRGQVSGVTLESGERLPATVVIFNGDCNALAQGLLGDAHRRLMRPRPPAARSLSALTFAGRMTCEPGMLEHHNVFFSNDYRREFDDLRRQHRLPADPTVYVCAPQQQGGNATSVFALLNAPASTGDAVCGPASIAAARAAATTQLQRAGLAVDFGDFETTTPRDFAARFPATHGALYGPAMHGWRAAFRRPGSRTPLRGLYLAGGSTHPGSGVPMAAISGMLAAAAASEDFAASRSIVANAG